LGSANVQFLKFYSRTKSDFMKHCSSCGNLVIDKIPDGDNRHRWICERCDIVHYQNPKIIVGSVAEQDGKILLCRRAIEPRYGYWTVPAGFMELGETMEQGATRETFEEACAEVQIGRLYASVDVVEAGQVHLFFTAILLSDFSAGDESLEAALFSEQEIPWPEIAFRSGKFALEKFFEDAGENNGVHMHQVVWNRR
jgi:ADP-ribose pyrophosphatase YjhB (NUDIX family)